MKNYFFGLALFCLMLMVGCAKGGNGAIPVPVAVSLSPPNGINTSALYPTESVVITATVTG
jgi:hypothetical protein